jgi:hypothetical protein
VDVLEGVTGSGDLINFTNNTIAITNINIIINFFTFIFRLGVHPLLKFAGLFLSLTHPKN